MSFIRKISQKNNDELTSKSDGVFIIDGVYILHETLGVKMVKGWDSKNNDGVVGILLVEGEHQIVVATEDAPKKLIWSKEPKSVNQPIEKLEDAESDFNGEYYCQKLNSPDFPAAYYCKTYNKGNRDWYLPSSGELWIIYNHLEEIQTSLETVGGKGSLLHGFMVEFLCTGAQLKAVPRTHVPCTSVKADSTYGVLRLAIIIRFDQFQNLIFQVYEGNNY